MDFLWFEMAIVSIFMITCNMRGVIRSDKSTYHATAETAVSIISTELTVKLLSAHCFGFLSATLVFWLTLNGRQLFH